MWGCYPKNFAILFILVIALYTCLPLPPKANAVIGILVSITHLIAIAIEYAANNGTHHNEASSSAYTKYSTYMVQLVSNLNYIIIQK